jgi:glycosyltransferase involved in cell wall biosynthesis
MNPLISVIVITYNSDKTILETLESIRLQTYSNIELIVSDDCSKDNTIETCRKWIKNNSGRFVSTEIITTTQNNGIPANCNRGIMASHGEWVKIIAGDDLLFPDAFEFIVNEINNDSKKEKLAFHGKVIEFQDNQHSVNHAEDWGDSGHNHFNQVSTTAEDQFKILLRFCPVSAPTAIINKLVFEKVGYFDERFKFWEDRPMWLKMTAHGIKMHYISKNIVKYRRHPQSVQEVDNKTLFSRTVISKDEGYKVFILPHLPVHERILSNYIINIRSFFFRTFKNKKTFSINLIYKILIFCAEKMIIHIRRRYSP